MHYDLAVCGLGMHALSLAAEILASRTEKHIFIIEDHPRRKPPETNELISQLKQLSLKAALHDFQTYETSQNPRLKGYPRHQIRPFYADVPRRHRKK